jgi:hypothetical protein
MITTVDEIDSSLWFEKPTKPTVAHLRMTLRWRSTASIRSSRKDPSVMYLITIRVSFRILLRVLFQNTRHFMISKTPV